MYLDKNTPLTSKNVNIKYLIRTHEVFDFSHYIVLYMLYYVIIKIFKK